MKLNELFAFIIKVVSFITILILIIIIFFIIKESITVFKHISFLDFIFGTNWYPTKDNPQIGILHMILATIYISLLAIVLSLPIGVGSAIFLSTVANNKFKKIFSPMVDILAGIPSVIYGLVGFIVIVKSFEKYFLFASGESIFAGGILLSVMILPYIDRNSTRLNS